MDCKERNIYCARLYGLQGSNIYCARLYANTAMAAAVVPLVMFKLIPDKFRRLIGNMLC
jgi:hypothetical protein